MKARRQKRRVNHASTNAEGRSRDTLDRAFRVSPALPRNLPIAPVVTGRHETPRVDYV